MSWSRTNLLIAEAAAALGVQCRSVGSEHSDFLLQLCHGERAVFVSKTRSPFLTQVAQTLANHKHTSRELLARIGVPVVPAVLLDERDDAAGARVQAALQRWGTLVVKPNAANRARGVAAELTELAAVAAAIDRARALDPDEEALLEPYVPGSNLRLAIIGGRFEAAAEIRRPRIVGDGRTTMAAWFEQLNADARRASWRAPSLLPFDRIDADDEDVEVALAAHGLTQDSVLPPGAAFELLGEEAQTHDCTAAVHPGWRGLAERACAELGVDVGGIDLRGAPALLAQPPATRWQPGALALLEINVSPALHLHAVPSHGTPRPVYHAFVAYCMGLPGAPSPCATIRAAASGLSSST
ncbi:MAG: hypothetical protein K1X88_15775 [Nannocystaceae bacterium]|nr:hypothetical protein [Nannocystaceae bacterium]